MSTIKELREKSATIAMQARELFADETKTAEVDRMLAEHDALEVRIAQAQRLEIAEARNNEADERRPIEARAGTPKAERNENYAKAFDQLMRAGGDERELASESRAALRAGMEIRDGQIIGTQSAGGYLVPTLLDTQIVVAQKFYNALTPENTTWFSTSTGANMTIVQRDSTNYKGHIPGEANAAVVNSVVYTDVVVGSYTVKSDIYKASWELLQDASFDVAADLSEHMGESMGRQINTYLTVGTGGGTQPTGIVTAVGTPSLATVANTGVIIDDFLALEAQVDIAYRRNPKTAYMFNDTTRLAIRKLKDTTGRYYWQPAVTLGDQETFNGYKFIINNDMVSQSGGAVFALFGDLSKFRVRNVEGLFLTRFNELYAANGQVGFLMTQRLDSLLVDLRAVKGLKGLT